MEVAGVDLAIAKDAVDTAAADMKKHKAKYLHAECMFNKVGQDIDEGVSSALLIDELNKYTAELEDRTQELEHCQKELQVAQTYRNTLQGIYDHACLRYQAWKDYIGPPHSPIKPKAGGPALKSATTARPFPANRSYRP